MWELQCGKTARVVISEAHLCTQHNSLLVLMSLTVALGAVAVLMGVTGSLLGTSSEVSAPLEDRSLGQQGHSVDKGACNQD